MPRSSGLNGNLEQTIEDYNYANLQLAKIDRDLTSNAKHLVAAKKSLVVAQRRIAVRARDLYINGEGDSTLEVLLGSSSLDDIIARLDAIERVSSQDSQILRTVKTYRKEVETRRDAPGQASRPGADRRRTGRTEGVDRIADRRAEPAARVGQGRDHEDARGGGAAAGGARSAGACACRCSGATRQPGAARCHAADLRHGCRHAHLRPEPPRRSLRRCRRRSHSSTSACPTSGVAQARRPASTAPAS